MKTWRTYPEISGESIQQTVCRISPRPAWTSNRLALSGNIFNEILELQTENRNFLRTICLKSWKILIRKYFLQVFEEKSTKKNPKRLIKSFLTNIGEWGGVLVGIFCKVAKIYLLQINLDQSSRAGHFAWAGREPVKSAADSTNSQLRHFSKRSFLSSLR